MTCTKIISIGKNTAARDTLSKESIVFLHKYLPLSSGNSFGFGDLSVIPAVDARIINTSVWKELVHLLLHPCGNRFIDIGLRDHDPSIFPRQALHWADIVSTAISDRLILIQVRMNPFGQWQIQLHDCLMRKKIGLFPEPDQNILNILFPDKNLKGTLLVDTER